MSKNKTNDRAWLLTLTSMSSSAPAVVMFSQSGALVFEMLGITREPRGSFWSGLLSMFVPSSVWPTWVTVGWVVCILGLGFLYCGRRRMPKAAALYCIACGHDLAGRMSKPCAECGNWDHFRGREGEGIALRGLNIFCGFVGFIFLAAALAPWCAGIYKGAIAPGSLWLIVFVSTGNLLAGYLLVWSIRTLWLCARQERLKRSTLRCEHCGYNLTGNVTGRCPECGTPCKAPTGAGEAT